MTIQKTLAALAAATGLLALPVAAATPDHGGNGGCACAAHKGGDHGESACQHGGSAGAGQMACQGHGQAVTAAAAAGSNTAPRAARQKGAQVVRIDVTGDGFVPARASVKAGRPVTLVVTRKTDRTCATQIVIKDYGVDRALPIDQAVEVTFTPKKAGPIRYACGMDMVAGELVAE